MKKVKNAPQKLIILFVVLFFGAALLVPMITIFVKSLSDGSGFTLENYRKLFVENGVGEALVNGVLVSLASAVITTVLAFIPAYAINYTNIHLRIKKLIKILVMIPMFLPTITYGFALIYSFGKQGLITRLLGFQLFDIYGVGGLIIGYVLYTLPISFMLINNSMGYIDKKFMVVSRMLGDSRLRCFMTTVISPLIGTLAVSLIQSFALCFTDYGIPASLAGNVKLISTMLYNQMLGSLPDFNAGSAVSVIMLLPSVISIILIQSLKKYNVRYNKISEVELEKNKARDIIFGVISGLMILFIIAVFAVIFVVPFVEQWPYRMNFSTEHIASILSDTALMDVYKNSLIVAALTALFGTVIAYGSALVSARKGLHQGFGKIPDTISLVANTIPGMVLGVAYLLCFKGSFLHNSFAILIICNIVHHFSSPYLMMKSGLEKLNASWETTARLMGDSWLKTVLRIITPNSFTTILEVFSYYFVNSMVTISALIFLVSTRTMIITAKIKELQHFANFNEIFVLSILILLTNLVVKGLIRLLEKINKKEVKRK